MFGSFAGSTRGVAKVQKPLCLRIVYPNGGVFASYCIVKRIVKTSCARANHARFKEGLQLLQEDAQAKTAPPKIELPRSADLFYLVPAVVSCCRLG